MVIILNFLAGLPGPVMPPLFIIKDMITQSILTAIIAFAINFSLADLFSKTHRYKININQELFAYGATNIFSGFFPCFTTGASLARSCVQNNAGGRTQVIFKLFDFYFKFIINKKMHSIGSFIMVLSCSWHYLARNSSSFQRVTSSINLI
jgi:hypothetical protein